MSEPGITARERPWRRLVLAVVVLLMILLGLALWSQRDDSLRLSPERLESTEVTTP